LPPASTASDFLTGGKSATCHDPPSEAASSPRNFGKNFTSSLSQQQKKSILNFKPQFSLDGTDNIKTYNFIFLLILVY
jgi:hypothetical protein